MIVLCAKQLLLQFHDGTYSMCIMSAYRLSFSGLVTVAVNMAVTNPAL